VSKIDKNHMAKLRPIVRAAFKCRALEYQFEVIDVEDGLLTSDDIEAEVNEKYSDAYIIGEAKNRLDICNDSYNLDDPYYQREARQLQSFLKRFNKAVA